MLYSFYSLFLKPEENSKWYDLEERTEKGKEKKKFSIKFQMA